MEPDLILRREWPATDALRRAGDALAAIGTCDEVSKSSARVRGQASGWGKPVFVDVRVFPHGENGSELRVDAVGVQLLGTEARDNVLRRFEDAFDNLDKPGYQPDRVGFPREFVWFVVAVACFVAAMAYVSTIGRVAGR